MTNEIQLETGDALFIVDLQNDFCPGGALPIKDGDKVVPVANEWLRKAAAGGIPVYASRDWHPKEHISFTDEGGKWPPHCIQDTRGASFHGDLQLPEETVVVTKGVRFDKDQNSAFDETGLEAALKRKGIRRLLVCGLALDVCVLATVMDARGHGFDVALLLDGTRPVTEADGRAAVEKMKQAGVLVLGQSVEKEMGEAGKGVDAQETHELPVCTKAPEWVEHERLTDADEPCDDGRAGKS